MLDSRYGSVFFGLMFSSLFWGPVTRCCCQDADGFRFEVHQRSDVYQNEVSIPTGLQEGFDSEKLLAGIGGERLSNALLGWFSFGDTRSRSIAVLLTDETPRRLFVDLDRDRILKPSELISPAVNDPPVWLVDLDAEFVQPDAKPMHQRQQVRIGVKPDAEQLTLAATGSMNGTVEFAGAMRSARYTDRNANGRWFDADDRLFVDLNGDGKLDPLLERLPCQGMRQIEGQLYAIAGDDAGRWLKIEAVHDRGAIVPVVKLADAAAKVISIEASIAADSGMQVRVDALDLPVEVPVGTWNVATVRITVQGDSGVYSFVFETLNSKVDRHLVETDATVEFDLLGPLSITATTSTMVHGDGSTKTVTPLLQSGSGLYLTNSRTGKQQASNENRLFARSEAGGRQFHIASTGFT